MTMFRTAETEKYAHVTYFFNGGFETPYPGEERLLVPSPKVATYDLMPEMSAAGVTDVLCKAIEAGQHDFILCNYANGDMVGHSGVLSAAVKAVETVDRCLARVLAVLLSVGPAVRPAAAQVGYPPDRSPFHDVKLGGTFVFGVGYLGGSRGKVGVGPSDGNVFGIRYELPIGRALVAMLGVSDALTSRYVVDPTKDSASRTSGPKDNSLVLADAGLHLRLAGAKTWHGLAPELGISLGVAYAARVPGDSSQYDFSTKITFGP